MTGEYKGYKPRPRREGSARRWLNPTPDYWEAAIARADASVSEPFVGVTIEGKPLAGLFPLRETGIPTERIRQAADAFIATLRPEQRKVTLHPVDSQEWRRWSNWEQYPRATASRWRRWAPSSWNARSICCESA